MKHLLYVISLILVMAIGGCISQKNIPQDQSHDIWISRHVAYPHTATEVAGAYLLAIEEMGLRVDSSGSSEIRASSMNRRNPVSIVIRIGESDTLLTSAMIESSVGGGDFIHYPYEVSTKAWRHLDDANGFAFAYPQTWYPSHRTDCRGPVQEPTDDLVTPVLHGGLEGLASRLQYTEEARQAGIEGRVYVRFVVDEQGQVECAVVDAGLPGGLNEKAITAVVQSRFDPARRSGKPVKMTLMLPVTFRFRS